MNDDRIDFSSLDRMADPVRFERAVRAVLAGVTQEPARPPFLVALLFLGRRAVLAAGAAAVAVWVAASLAPAPLALTDREPARDPAALLSAWAEAGGIPKDVDVLQVMEVADGY